MNGVEQDKLKKQLFSAVINDKLDSVKDAIDKGANINAKDENGAIPLHLAACEGYLEIVKFLVSKGADINAKGKYGYTPLHFAALNGHLDVVKFLIEKGADVNAKEDDYTPLHSGVAGCLEVLTFLASIDAKDKNDFMLGFTPLYLAAGNGHLDVVKFLISSGADVKARDIFEQTPLHFVASKEVAEFLIEKGADFKAQGNFGHTPLHCAARDGRLDVVELLISKGADVPAKDISSYTPLFEAVVNGHLNVAKFLSKSRNGFTPLHWEALAGHLDVVKSLISNGADINVEDEYGCTPLYWAALANRLDVVKFLINKGADIDAKDKGGYTPLSWAASVGHMDVAELLIKHTLLNPSAKQPNFSQEELNTHWTKCAEELKKLEQEYPEIFKFLCANSLKESVKTWVQNGDIIQNESIFQNKARLEEQYPECADIFINIFAKKANQCKAVTSLGKFVAKHDVAFKFVSGLSLLAGAAFCASGCLATGISLLIAGVFVFGLSTDIGWGMYKKVSNKFNNPDIAQPAQTAEATI